MGSETDMRRQVLVIGAAVLMSACNRGSMPTLPLPALPIPTAPQTTYACTITDSVSGAGTLTVTLGTAGSSVGGTWTETFPGQRVSTRFITGTVNGANYSATVQCSSFDGTFTCIPDCRQTFTGTLTSDSLSCTYAEAPGDTCAARRGSVTANRQ